MILITILSLPLVLVGIVCFVCAVSAFISAKDGTHEGWHLPALYMIPLSIALGFMLLAAIAMETQGVETPKSGSVAKP